MPKRKAPSVSLPSARSSKSSSDSEKSKRVTIRKLGRGSLPALPLEALATHILGSRYTVSLVLVGDTRSRKLNERFRGKPYPTNILSFPLSDAEGELVLNLHRCEQEAVRSRVPLRHYVLYLLTHGMLHLRGLDHGDKMATLEKKYLAPHVSKDFLTWLGTD